MLCRLGFHRLTWYDSAMFTSARRCGVCGDYTDPVEGAALERERQAWTEGRISLGETDKKDE